MITLQMRKLCPRSADHMLQGHGAATPARGGEIFHQDWKQGMTQRKQKHARVLSKFCYSTLEDVRTLLVRVDAYLRAADTPNDWVEDVNIILAEILSNISRHGYVDSIGRIDLEIHLCDDELWCSVSDTGRPFDAGILCHEPPEPTLLREGGYGAFLIRSLARGLTYRRFGGRNRLTFWVPVGTLQVTPELAD